MVEAEITNEPVEFWFVWTKHGKVPRYTHTTEESALAEAARLAVVRRGAKFIVLKAVHKLSVPEFGTPPANAVIQDAAQSA